MLKLYVNIREHRKAAKMTQEELARRTGYTDRSSIARIEKGEIDLPQSKIKQFAEVFGISPGELMGWDETPADELQGLGALAADILMDPGALEMMQQYMRLSAGDQATARAVVAALSEKTKKE